MSPLPIASGVIREHWRRPVSSVAEEVFEPLRVAFDVSGTHEALDLGRAVREELNFQSLVPRRSDVDVHAVSIRAERIVDSSLVESFEGRARGRPPTAPSPRGLM
jgi:hypothetical protein